MSASQVKGWCPGAYRPMMAADGLVVRIRPRMARLDADQTRGLCALAMQYGSGFIDLTSRANLQIRGVTEADHEPLLRALNVLGLLDPDPDSEQRRNILMTPFWTPGDQAARLAEGLMEMVNTLPKLPAKVGYAIDCGPAPVLGKDPADFRIERRAGGLILRADGVALGRPVSEDAALDALAEMVNWFVERMTPKARRMRHVTALHHLPGAWRTHEPDPSGLRPRIGARKDGAFVGAPFGQLDAQALTRAMDQAAGLRVTPWRCVLLEGAPMPADPAFLTTANDPLGQIDACPGAPLCSSASVNTRDLARRLAPIVQGSLHVSGCSKGCARATSAKTTLIGRDGRFDLVQNGTASDTPAQTGLTPEDLATGVL